jgi:hypothetical protein
MFIRNKLIISNINLYLPLGNDFRVLPVPKQAEGKGAEGGLPCISIHQFSKGGFVKNRDT